MQYCRRQAFDWPAPHHFPQKRQPLLVFTKKT
jgi:hypothetical protein